ncbi:sensor histidine kinase [Streptomyces sp. S186]|uniref:sensor histidine kinase n=1 Tax=Streptomyces sp. S186 TaxID=3434395 RepID=UPI003F67BBD9
MPRLARYRYATLCLQALLTYLPFLAFKNAWLGMPGFLAGSMALALHKALAWPFLGLVVASTVVIQFSVGYGWEDVAYNGVSTLITALVVFGLSRLADLVREVHAAQSDVAALAVTQERLRFARDLHDMLGYSLSTLTVKCEVARKMVGVDPVRAEQELAEVVSSARAALADVRAVASGYRGMSLVAEVAAAKSVLEAVGIRTATRVADLNLPQAVNDTLAAVVREAVTNLLRHSKAQRCRIVVSTDDGTARLLLRNDGASAKGSVLGEGQGAGGRGLVNLTERAQALGGRLTAGPEGNGWFQLDVSLPLRSPRGPGTGPPKALTASPSPGRSLPRPSDCAR